MQRLRGPGGARRRRRQRLRCLVRSGVFCGQHTQTDTQAGPLSLFSSLVIPTCERVSSDSTACILSLSTFALSDTYAGECSPRPDSSVHSYARITRLRCHGYASQPCRLLSILIVERVSGAGPCPTSARPRRSKGKCGKTGSHCPRLIFHALRSLSLPAIYSR